MGVKIFRDDNWHRITNGAISRRDIMYLDAEKDRELIRYLAAHASEPVRRSVIRYAVDRYGMDESPQPLISIDDPDDTFFWEYAVLREQVMREDDCDVLKEAALHYSDFGPARFAFCRLTGYSFPPDACDAYSYRTFECGIVPQMTAEDVRAFCRRIILERGQLENAARECLRHREDTDH